MHGMNIKVHRKDISALPLPRHSRLGLAFYDAGRGSVP
jgi:hypothetical protein